MRSKIISDLIDKLTPEFIEEMKQKRLSRIKELSLEYQLGLYVGEYIVSRYLPTLSVSLLTSNKVINVTSDEQREYERLTDIWFKKTHKEGKEASKHEWDESIQYYKSLQKKYLPQVLDCYIHPLNIQNEDLFKNGLKRALWDCDMCSYKCTTNEDITIEHDDNGYYSKIKLFLDC